MSVPRDAGGPVQALGIFLLGLGVTGRILVPPPPVTPPVIDVFPAIALLAGSGAVLLDRMLRRGPPLPAILLLLPLLVVPGLFPPAPLALAKGIDFLAAIAAGLGLLDLVRHEGFGRPTLRMLLATAALVAAIAIAQALYQRAEAREAALEAGVGRTEQERAFLASPRAPATLVNPNTLGGFLLLVLPFAVLRAVETGPAMRRVAGALLVAVLGAALGATGSAGALLALLLGTATLLLVRPPPPAAARRLAMGALALGLAGIAVLLAGVITGWRPPGIGGKIDTFLERVDYHRLGLALLPHAGLHGIGFEATRDLGRELVRPGDAWSAYLHDSWLQLLVEGGPLLLAGGAVLALVLVRLVRGPGPPASVRRDESAAGARLLFAGVLLAAAAAPFASRMVTVLPFAIETPLASAATNVLLVVLTLRGTRAFAPAPAPLRLALVVGLASFCLHALLDFDLYVAGVATTFAAVLALVPPRARHPTPRALELLLAATLLVLPLPVGLHALARDQAGAALEVLRREPDHATALRTLEQVAGADPEALAPLVLNRASSDPRGAEGWLASLPERVRARPSGRRLEARYLARRALEDPRFAGEALRRLPPLLREDERLEAELRYRLAVVHAVAGDDAARRAQARAGLEAAERWGLDEDEAPFLEDLRKLAEE